MSAITKSLFAPSSMDVVSLEAKGSKGSKGSRPETKRKLEPKNRNLPGTILPRVYGPIPPKDKHEPNVMYINPNCSVAEMSAEKSLVGSSISEEDTNRESSASRTVLSWKNASIYESYAEKARGSSSSGKSGPITYDGYKSVVVCSSSDVGSKSTAVYSPDSSSSNCSIS